MLDLTVVYEAGVFKPVIPLALPEGQRLQIRILEPEILPVSLLTALNPLVRCGALTLPTGRWVGLLPEVSLAQSSEYESYGMPGESESYGVDQIAQNLLSESIIEDRGPF